VRPAVMSTTAVTFFRNRVETGHQTSILVRMAVRSCLSRAQDDRKRDRFSLLLANLDILPYLRNPSCVGWGIPIFLFAITLFGRTVIRQQLSFSIWFLGLETSIAAFATTLTDIADLARHGNPPADQLLNMTVYLMVEFIGFVIILLLHRWLGECGTDGKIGYKHVIFLFILSNLLAFALLSGYFLEVKS
jgi:hypothetical protein